MLPDTTAQQRRGTRPRLAVIGAGVAGLTAAYLLQRRYDVTLYEADDRLGGHAHTHDVVTPDDGVLRVDSGFIVFNDRTYPQLRRLFAELGVRSQSTTMSMSIRCEGCGLEYAGARGVGGVFAQVRSLGRPEFLRMLWEVRRFHRLASEWLAAGDDALTLRGFLVRGQFSDYFIGHFMVPLVSCVWSASSEMSLEYPARYLFTFLDNHGMLSVAGSPTWRTVTGGSRTYVERIVKDLTSVNVNTPVRAVLRHAGGVEVRDEADRSDRYAGAVIATHADTALSLLPDPTEAQRAALGAFGYSHNRTWLHSDTSLLPVARRARSSWNYLLPTCGATSDRVLVSYDLNRLQGVPPSSPALVTLNATDRIDPSLVLARMEYSHPTFTTSSVAAQALLPALNDGVLAFAGAYHGWGFHEDGCGSGVAAAASFGVTW